jgi:hypothetical protein
MVMKGTLRRPVLGALFALALAAPASAGTHVRVVLDTSRSMQRYDSPCLAKLSALLLYDLALTNSTLGDSFEVLPFHPTQRWNDESDPPPTRTGPRIRADLRDRAALARSLTGLRYDAQMTYFYPGLLESIGELEATPGGASDVRVIVLVTDGMPEPDTRDEEERLIREELAPRLDAASIRLYVLAFGPQAYPNRAFFDRLVQGERLGKVFADPDGSGLLENMMQIFSRSFGYVQDPARTLPAGPLDLADGKAPDRVAVVLFRRDPTPPPLALRTPQGGAVNMADGIREGRERQASYQMTWVLSPRPGGHPIDATAPGATVAVLRPMPVTLEVLPPKTGSRVLQVMGGKEVRLEVLVRPAAGGAGDPGEVNLTYQTHGERTGGEFAWDGDVQAPPAGGDRLVPRGRIYPIFPIFPEPQKGEAFYVGHLEVTAKRGVRAQASLSGAQAQRVEVYPLVSISPVPALGDAVPAGSSAVRALGRWERGCARFRLDVAGRLPEQKEYSLRAIMAASTPTKGGLAGASWTLDGLPLEIDGGAPGPYSPEWTRGRALAREDLFGEHEACVQAGKPLAGNPGKPYELPIGLTLVKSPYDAPGVTEPFLLKVLIAPPTWIERWEARLWAVLSLLALLAAFWFLRGRPDLPEDLRAAVGRSDSRVVPMPRPLAESSLAARFLGLVPERPVFSEIGGERLGVMRPVRDGLYRFRPARGVRVETPEGRPVEIAGGWADLSVHRTYHLRHGESEHQLRVEFQ